MEDVLALTDELTAAYAEALHVSYRLRPVLVQRYSESGLGRHLRVPRLGLFTRYFVALHVARAVGPLRRALLHQETRAAESAAYVERLERLDRVERVLPRGPRLAVHVPLVPAVLGLAYLGALPFGGSARDLEPLRTLMSDVLQPAQWGKLEHDLNMFHGGSILFGTTGFAAVVWLLVLGPMTSYHLKRMLFTLCPGSGDDVANAPLAALGTAGSGIYERERRVFALLGARRPRELRLDLVVDAVLAMLAVALSTLVATSASTEGRRLPHVDLHALLRHPASHGVVSMPDVHGLQFLAVIALAFASLAQARPLALELAAWRRSRGPRVQVEAFRRAWIRRIAAYALDLCLLAALWVGVLAAVAAAAPSALESGGDIVLACLVIGPLAAAVAYVALGYVTGSRAHGFRSLGKRLVRLSVASSTVGRPPVWRVLLREVVLKLVTLELLLLALLLALAVGSNLADAETAIGCGVLLAFLLPFLLLDPLWALRSGDGRMLHDVLSGTQVVRLVREPRPRAVEGTTAPAPA